MVNCMRCRFRNEDNGNCTAVGGFCTAVPAAHCPLLREYLDTGLTPAEVLIMSAEWCAMWCNRKNKLCSDYCPHCGAKMDKEE